MANNEKAPELNNNNPEISSSQTPKIFQKKQYIFKTNKWRVKLYHLNENGEWEDFGIGYVFCAFEEKDLNIQETNKEIYQKLIMLNEDTHEEMFNIEIKKNTIDFHNQRGIIITWKIGNDINEDNTAISFQEKEGVFEIWNNILINQGKNPLDKNNSLLTDQPEAYLDVSIQNLPNLFRELNSDMNELKINNFISFLKKSNFEFIIKLGEILNSEEKKLEEIKSSISTETNYTIIQNNNNLNENNKKNDSLSKFSKNENNIIINNQISLTEKQKSKSTNIENINYIFNIFKNLILLGNKELIEILLNDICYLITFGALEYDFEVFKIVPHRKYFKEVVKFKNPLKIEDEEILEKIHLNIRLQYLRDPVLARIIDNNTLKSINMIIQINNNDIIQFFIEEDKYLDTLCEQLQDNNILVKRDAFLLFNELINCSKDIYQTRIAFYETLFELGIIHALIENLEGISNNEYINSINLEVLNKNDILLIQEKIINIIIEIITNFLTVLPNEFKIILKCDTLLKHLTNLMLNFNNFGIKYEICNIFKMLIDINYYKDDDSVNDLSLYNEYFISFLKYLKMPIDPNRKTEISTTKQIIIEILIYLFSQNIFDIQFWINQNELDKIILNLLEESNKIVNLYTIKLIKCIIEYTDLSICSKIFSKKLCNKIIQLFIDNIKNGNIIISCLLDFFEILYHKDDEIFNLIIDQNKEFFTQSEYKIFFKNINVRIENKPKEEKHLINYIKINNYKDFSPTIKNNIKDEDENQINNSYNTQFYNNINNNNLVDLKLNEEAKVQLLEKKRNRYFGNENEYDEKDYYNEEYLNEYDESENFQKYRKKQFSIFEEDEDLDNLNDNIIDNENKINGLKNRNYNNNKMKKITK